MKVVVDADIPYVAQPLRSVMQVVCLPAQAITPDSIRDADALIIRTRTRVDEHLLDGSRVRFIATATIGYDHIDSDYCRHTHRTVISCPGCNAQAVCDYVHEALSELILPHYNPASLTLGVVGVGHVGTKVAAMAEQLGFRVLRCDPPLGLNTTMEQIAQQSDIITFHVPLTTSGPHPTCHMASAGWLNSTRPHALIINAARGGVVDEQALLCSDRPCVIDCWENEPFIRHDLLLSTLTQRASCHIAGYSIEGKQNASQHCLDTLCQFFSLPALIIDKKEVPLQGDSDFGWLQRLTMQLQSRPSDFEIIRKQYKLR